MGKYSGKTCRLLTMLSMTASFFLVEIIVGYITNSIALVADSFHMLSDVVALIVGFASVRISKWRTQKNTFGWARAEVLGALVNSVFLIALCFSIMVEALKRLVEPEEIQNPKLMLIVGGLGLLVNFIGLGLFHQHGHSHGGGGHSHGKTSDQNNHKNEEEENSKSPEETPVHTAIKESEKLVNNHSTENGDGHMSVLLERESDSEQDHDEVVIEFDRKRMSSSAQLNMRAVFLHVLGDALGSIIVVISALMIWFIDKDWVYYVDPAMSLVMVCIILSTTIPLLKEASLILMQTVPTHIKINDIKEKIEQITGVQGIHEFHVWQLTGNRVIASAHVCCSNPQEYMVILEKVKTLFHNEGIHSVTIQPEYSEVSNIGPSCSSCYKLVKDWKYYEITCAVRHPVLCLEHNFDTNFMLSSQDCMFACGPERNCNPDTCCPVPSRSSSSTKRNSVKLTKRSNSSNSEPPGSPTENHSET